MKTRYSGPTGPNFPGPKVRLLGPKGEELGVMPTESAVQRAEEMKLDLVVVSPRANPPVCRLMNYSRFKFENAKKAKAALRQSHQVAVKEVRLRPTTDDRDLLLKAETVRRLLLDRHKVRLVVTFRGREVAHLETGRDVLERITKSVADVGAVEEAPTLDGRQMSLLIRPT